MVVQKNLFDRNIVHVCKSRSNRFLICKWRRVFCIDCKQRPFLGKLLAAVLYFQGVFSLHRQQLNDEDTSSEL